jgi:hypothetical protein
VDITPARVQKWAAEHASLRGLWDFPVTWGHLSGGLPESRLATPQDDEIRRRSVSNAGYIRELIPVGGGGLDAVVDCPGLDLDGGNLVTWVRGPDGTEVKTAIKDVSIAFGSWRDGKGVLHDDIIRHIAITPLPVIPGQRGFTALSTIDAAKYKQTVVGRRPSPNVRLAADDTSRRMTTYDHTFDWDEYLGRIRRMRGRRPGSAAALATATVDAAKKKKAATSSKPTRTTTSSKPIKPTAAKPTRPVTKPPTKMIAAIAKIRGRVFDRKPARMATVTARLTSVTDESEKGARWQAIEREAAAVERKSKGDRSWRQVQTEAALVEELPDPAERRAHTYDQRKLAASMRSHQVEAVGGAIGAAAREAREAVEQAERDETRPAPRWRPGDPHPEKRERSRKYDRLQEWEAVVFDPKANHAVITAAARTAANSPRRTGAPQFMM